jgi:NAD(P)H-dependent FMN reductase
VPAGHATPDIRVATIDDVRWADALAFGTPARFSDISAALKQLLVAQAGGNPYGTSHASAGGAPIADVIAAGVREERVAA